MKCNHLFLDSDVAFVKLNGDPDFRKVKSYAASHGVKIKINTGYWVNPETLEVEKISKLQLQHKEGAQKNKEFFLQRISGTREEVTEKRKKILELRKQGLTMQKIADILGTSKQNVSLQLKIINGDKFYFE